MFFDLKGLDWAVGGRCFLEVLVLRHSVCHNVFMETICEQPKASTVFQLDSWSIPSLFLFVTRLLICLDLHRYAFTPLIDDSDDEEIEEFIASSNLGALTWKRYLNAVNILIIFVLIFFPSHFSVCAFYPQLMAWSWEHPKMRRMAQWGLRTQTQSVTQLHPHFKWAQKSYLELRKQWECVIIQQMAVFPLYTIFFFACPGWRFEVGGG